MNWVSMENSILYSSGPLQWSDGHVRQARCRPQACRYQALKYMDAFKILGGYRNRTITSVQKTHRDMIKSSQPVNTSCMKMRSLKVSQTGALGAMAKDVALADPKSITEQMFSKLKQKNDRESGAMGAGGETSYADLKRLDQTWYDIRNKEIYGPRPVFVRNSTELLSGPPKYDIIIAGGTLGIFVAAGLQRKGMQVALVERAPSLKGRSQEWNISRKELYELVKSNIFSIDEIEDCIASEFNPVRARFDGGKDIWTQDVLNLGVSPAKLIETAKKKFIEFGGEIFEGYQATSLFIHPNGAQLNVKSTNRNERPSVQNEFFLTSKLVVDCMGNASPIIRQIRHGRKPDGICLVVGSCARGFDPEKNTTGDIILTNAPSEPPISQHPTSEADLHNLQLFWEAFPSGSGPTDRTTYMFTYVDATPERPSLEQLLEHYWSAMPHYQGICLEDIEVQRILFGLFPTYRDSPVQFPFDRVMAIGDAGGLQSPLSFGGFAALMRHFGRLLTSIPEAVSVNALDSSSLRFISPYNPGLSSAWMLQKAMSIPAKSSSYDRNFINRLLAGNFASMEEIDEGVLRTFLQDVIQAGPLTKTLFKQVTKDPLFVPHIFARVGVRPLMDWVLHFMGLLLFTGAYKIATDMDFEGKAIQLFRKQHFLIRRALERWKFGSGLDHESNNAD